MVQRIERGWKVQHHQNYYVAIVHRSTDIGVNLDQGSLGWVQSPIRWL